MIVYTKLENVLKEREITKDKLRENIDVAPNTIAKIKKNETLTTTVIDKICAYLHVQPGDIMEYVDDEIIKEKEKADIQAQIEKLKKQLEEL